MNVFSWSKYVYNTRRILQATVLHDNLGFFKVSIRSHKYPPKSHGVPRKENSWNNDLKEFIKTIQYYPEINSWRNLKIFYEIPNSRLYFQIISKNQNEEY